MRIEVKLLEANRSGPVQTIACFTVVLDKSHTGFAQSLFLPATASSAVASTREYQLELRRLPPAL